MEQNEEIIKELNNFLKGINMGYETFETYKEKLNDENLKNEFAKIISIFNSQKEVVISHIENLNGDPKDSLGIGGEIASMFEKLKDIFVNTDDEILYNAIKGMDMGMQGSEKVISSLEKITSDKNILKSLNDIMNEFKVIYNKLNEIYQKIEK